jgi:hypothetical protein
MDLGLGEDIVENDPRRATAVAVQEEAALARPDIAALFTGTPLANDSKRLDGLLQARSAIREQWGKARTAFLTIGRKLVEIESVLNPEEYRRFRAEIAKILPFSDSNASKFRMIAIAVRDGKLPEKQLPASFGTAYELSTLDAVGLQVAAARHLIRQDVERSAVMALKRDLKKGLIIEGTAEPVGDSAGKVSITALRRNRDRIQREIDKLDDKRNLLIRELAEAEAKIAEASGAE